MAVSRDNANSDDAVMEQVAARVCSGAVGIMIITVGNEAWVLVDLNNHPGVQVGLILFYIDPSHLVFLS
jgi:hypothetical protein